MQNITPCLWFDSQAEEATRLYTSTIKDSKIENIVFYGEEGPLPKGTIQMVEFHLKGQKFLAINGGPVFSFTPAISFIINCQTQQEIDELWEKLSEGGEKQQCGWLKDKYGVSWQIVPSELASMLKDNNKAPKVMKVLMQMDKLDIKRLKQAYE